MAAKLALRVEKLEAHAGALQGHRAVIVRLSNCRASMDEEDFKETRHRLLGEIANHEEADTIITIRDFIFPDQGEHLEPEIAKFQWQTWGNR